MRFALFFRIISINRVFDVREENDMFENVDTRKDNEDFEKKITQIYNKYSKIEISDEYLELWNGFVELIQFVQGQDTINNMSPMEIIKLMKEIGLSNREIKELFLQQMKEK